MLVPCSSGLVDRSIVQLIRGNNRLLSLHSPKLLGPYTWIVSEHAFQWQLWHRLLPSVGQCLYTTFVVSPNWMHSVVELHMLNAHELDLLTPSCRYVGLLLRLERTSRYSWTFPCTSGHSTVNCRMSARGSSGSQHVLDEKEIPSVLSLNQLACVTFLSISIASTQCISFHAIR